MDFEWDVSGGILEEVLPSGGPSVKHYKVTGPGQAQVKVTYRCHREVAGECETLSPVEDTYDVRGYEVTFEMSDTLQTGHQGGGHATLSGPGPLRMKFYERGGVPVVINIDPISPASCEKPARVVAEGWTTDVDDRWWNIGECGGKDVWVAIADLGISLPSLYGNGCGPEISEENEEDSSYLLIPVNGDHDEGCEEPDNENEFLGYYENDAACVRAWAWGLCSTAWTLTFPEEYVRVFRSGEPVGSPVTLDGQVGNFWFEGLKACPEASMVLNYGGYSDTVKFRILGVDLDMDSDNNSRYSFSGDEAEDKIEANSPGKAIAVYSDDDDGDGVLDTQDACIQGAQFVTMGLSAQGMDLSGATVEITYGGGVRIWKADAGQTRTGADLLVSGTEYPASDLLQTTGNRILYVEGVSAGAGPIVATLTTAGMRVSRDVVAYTCCAVGAVKVVPKGWTGGSDTAPSQIAAGGFESESHQADVRVEMSPAVGSVPVKVTLLGGEGHGKSAALTMPDTGDYLWTNSAGVLDGGVLTSGDVCNSCTVKAGSVGTTMSFGWDSQKEDNEWVSDPPYFVPGGQSVQTLKLTHHRGPDASTWKPLDQHTVNFYVEQVDVIEDGQTAHKYNSIEIPDDPNDPIANYAWFDPPGATDGNGVCTAALHVADNPNIETIHMVAYDFSVWDEPLSRLRR
jgi:hypothetical protein